MSENYRKVNAALKEQSEKLWHTTSIYHTEPIYEYAQALTATFPDPLKVGYSIETKLKILLQSVTIVVNAEEISQF